jgi:hypothetical protein
VSVAIETNHPLIEEILSGWKDRIGDDYAGYRGHVYRMFNFCLALRQCSEEEKTKLAVTACLHDIGLWSDNTVDYIPPSIVEAKRYLSETGREAWSEEIGLTIELHRKVRPYRGDRSPLVEVFRKGDLVDFSIGFFKCGLPKSFIKEVKVGIPNAGFHRFLMKDAKDWLSKHPLSPLPFMRW